MPQLTFAWPERVSYAAEDFIVSSSNQAAFERVSTWPDDNAHVLLLTGPTSCGKTHLAQSWAQRVQAAVPKPSLLGTITSNELWGPNYHALLEDIHTIKDESALFHMLRHAESYDLRLLLTSTKAPSLLRFALPDLHSRIVALPTTAIFPPDEDLLYGFLVKYFADRQCRVTEDALRYVIARIERSFVAARHFASVVEQKSKETKRRITIPLIKPLIDSLSNSLCFPRIEG